jgi:uncharacterized protein YkwD
MSASSRSSVAPVRSRRRRKVLALAGVAVLATTSAGCLRAEEQTFFDRTNALRSSRGVATLRDHDALNQKAELWARHLAETGVLAHSQVPQSLEALPWHLLGENVGVTSDRSNPLRTLQDQLAASPAHRANLLNEQFDHMGVGVAESADGRVWVVEVFADL